MLVIGCCLIVRVTVDTGENGVVCRVRVAIGAGSPFAGVSARIDREPRVIERRPKPRCRVVAGRAGRRECRGHVVRIGTAR
jgi:hypothetical protein